MKGLSTQTFPENSAQMEVGGTLVWSPPAGFERKTVKLQFFVHLHCDKIC